MIIFSSIRTASKTKITAIAFKIERVLLLIGLSFAPTTYTLYHFMTNKILALRIHGGNRKRYFQSKSITGTG